MKIVLVKKSNGSKVVYGTCLDKTSILWIATTMKQSNRHWNFGSGSEEYSEDTVDTLESELVNLSADDDKVGTSGPEGKNLRKKKWLNDFT